MIGCLSRWQVEDADKNCMHAQKCMRVKKIEQNTDGKRHYTVTTACFAGVDHLRRPLKDEKCV